MSVVLRATAALLIVVLAALAVLAVAAPRLLESDAVRAEIVGALVAAVGHEVTVEALELQLARLEALEIISLAPIEFERTYGSGRRQRAA